jgi:hypothetical protein
LETNKIITLVKGPQFNGGKSAYLFVLCMILLFLVLAFTINANYIGLLIVVPALVLCTHYMLDLRGIQLDLTDKLIRQYKQKLWGKKGKWMALNTFDKAILTHEFYKIKNTNYSDIADGDITTYKTTHGHFVVRLLHTKSKKHMIIAEEPKYSAAKKIIEKLVKHTGLNKEDTYQAKLMESMNMRSWQ